MPVNSPAQIIARFNAADWYWIAKTGSVYSSKRNALVYTYDSAYQAFLAANGAAAPWPTDATGAQTAAALQATLSFYGVNSGLTIPSP